MVSLVLKSTVKNTASMMMIMMIELPKTTKNEFNRFNGNLKAESSMMKRDFPIVENVELPSSEEIITADGSLAVSDKKQEIGILPPSSLRVSLRSATCFWERLLFQHLTIKQTSLRDITS